jgi:hypothetical protein
VTLALLTLPFFLAGVVAGSRLVLIAPPLLWSAFFGGVALGWWGSGFGDGWPFALLVLVAGGVVAAAAGLAVRSGVTRLRRSAGTGLDQATPTENSLRPSSGGSRRAEG